MSDSEVGSGSMPELTAREFDRLMAPFEPFEDHPMIAVGLSGGADSLALAMLLKDWVMARGGFLWALTVDHGLREESRQEADFVADRMAAWGVAHCILPWLGRKPTKATQAQARHARHRLLETFCQEKGVLHLCLAHHRDDQAETFLLRVRQQSGMDGLAAMAPSRERADCRLLRPFLSVPKARLVRSLEKQGESWVRDSSNHNLQYERVRLRQLAPWLKGQGLTTDRLAKIAQYMGRARQCLERETIIQLASTTKVHPAGFAVVKRSLLTSASPPVAIRALGRLLSTVRGKPYGPGFDPLTRLWRQMTAADFRKSSLHGCLISPTASAFLVHREAGRMPQQEISAGQPLHWDRRFWVRLPAAMPSETIHLGPLGTSGAAQIARWVKANAPKGVDHAAIPREIWPALPAFRAKIRGSDEFVLICVPFFGYLKRGFPQELLQSCRFLPERGPLTMAFTLV